MRAIVIDVEKQEIVERELGSDYKEILKHIGGGCDMLTTLRMPNGDTMFADDEGLLKAPTKGFKLESYPQPIMSGAVILGMDSMGDSIDASYTLEEVQAMVVLINRDEPIREDQIPPIVVTTFDYAEDD